MDKATNEHGDKWEDKKQPTETAREAYPQIYAKA